MRILIVSNVFHPENFRINDLAFYLSNKGHQVSILTQIPSYGKGKYFKNYSLIKNRLETYKNIKIYRCFSTPRGNGNIFLFINYLTFIFGSLIASLFFINKKIDKIFIFQTSPITVAIPAIFLKFIKKIPICMWVLDLWPESIYAASNKNLKFLSYITLPLVKFIYNKTDLILISSKGFLNSIIKKNIKSNKIKYFPQWSEDIFDNKIEKKLFKLNLKFLSKDSLKIMFAGNIGNSQDFPSILNAATYLNSLRKIKVDWIIVGDGRKFKWLKNEVKKKKLNQNFHLLGVKSLNEMPSYYKIADLMLITLKDEEIFSLTVPAKTQSYFAAGKIIAGMINGETQKVINNSNAGFAVNAGDFKKLAHKMIEHHNLSDIRKKIMKENSYQYYQKNYRRDILLENFEKYLINL